MNLNFGLIGAAGYIAPRHMEAIKYCGGNLVVATDPNSSVGILDRYSMDTKFFSETEEFEKHISNLRMGPEEKQVNWISICTPNYLHESHIRLALRNGANVICEKPLVMDPRQLDNIQLIESLGDSKVFTILQLRLLPSLIALRQKIEQSGKTDHDVVLTYITARGNWYDSTWKARVEQSGGVGTNIGIHLLDLMLWLFGDLVSSELHLSNDKSMSGTLQLKKGRVRWFLSIDQKYLPGSSTTYRDILVDGESIEFSKGFTELHNTVYQETLAGKGFDINTARPAIELAYRLRTTKEAGLKEERHPYLLRKV